MTAHAFTTDALLAIAGLIALRWLALGVYELATRPRPWRKKRAWWRAP